jgi:hypothetical protein
LDKGTYKNLDDAEAEPFSLAASNNNKEKTSERDFNVESGGIEMASFGGFDDNATTPTSNRAQSESEFANDTPLKKIIRTASGKVNLVEIDKQIHKVFVTPD